MKARSRRVKGAVIVYALFMAGLLVAAALIDAQDSISASELIGFLAVALLVCIVLTTAFYGMQTAQEKLLASVKALSLHRKRPDR